MFSCLELFTLIGQIKTIERLKLHYFDSQKKFVGTLFRWNARICDKVCEKKSGRRGKGDNWRLSKEKGDNWWLSGEKGDNWWLSGEKGDNWWFKEKMEITGGLVVKMR